jgi:beta-lactamase class A
MGRQRITTVVLLLILAAVGTFASMRLYDHAVQLQKKRVLLEQKRQSWLALSQVIQKETSSFPGYAGLIIKDLDNNWRIRLNQDQMFPSASLVKIPIMAACFNAASQGKLDLAEVVVLRGADKAGGSGRLKSMPAGSSWTVEQLIGLMVTQSDNTAANILIDRLGFDYLNGYFKQIGLTHTNLSRKMMDFRYRGQGVENYTTAADITHVLELIYQRRFPDPRVSEQCLALLKSQKVNDRIPAKLPPDVVVAHKTGLERFVCHDAGIVFTRQGDYLICVLTRSKGSFRQAKEFIARIAAHTYNEYYLLNLAGMKGGDYVRFK